MRISGFNLHWPLMGLIFCSTTWGQQLVNRPLLEELSRQTQSLYSQVSLGVVRVQLPTTRPVMLGAGGTTQPVDPTVNWEGKLSSQIFTQLQTDRTTGATYIAQVLVPPPSATQPTTDESARPHPPDTRYSSFYPNVMGIIVDDQGHALLPMYTARSNISDNEMLPVLLCDGSVAPAKFIGSDKVTNISVIQILRQGLRPMALGTVPPAEGSLVMVMSVDPVATALRVWTRWSGAMALVIQTDGTISGFSNRGQFVAAGSRVSVARQLIQFGHVERPILGVVISTVPPNDPIRAMLKSLGQEPAIHVDKVIDGSPAARSGLQDGDLVLTLAGAPVTTALDFATAVSERRGPTELGILRQDQEIQITVDVQSPPQN